jgi:hypothetical protein
MLLVLISLAMATIVTVGYLASRDNSAAIGENIASSAAARWAATSGLDLGIAVLETEADWRTTHVSGKLIDDYSVGPAVVDIDLLDLETGTPPTAGTNHVRIISTANVNGITQLAIAEAVVDDAGGDGGVTLDLSEFAVFASDTIAMQERTTITRWTAAPASAMGKRVALGTQSTAAGTIDIKGDAAAIDSTIYHGPSASGSLVLNTGVTAVDAVEVGDTIPMPDPPDPPTLWEGFTGFPSLSITGLSQVTGDIRYDSISLAAGSGVMYVNGDHTIIADNDLTLADRTGILVDGHATIVVKNDLKMGRDSYIELAPNATVTLFVADDVDIADAFIGEQRADKTDRDNTGTAMWIDPERIRIYSATPDSTSWKLHQNSVVKGSIYAPPSSLAITDDSAVYGRVAVKSLDMGKNGAVYYDHALDDGNGFTNTDSPIYASDGRIKDAIRLLSKLDDASLQTIAEELGVSIKALTKRIAAAEEPAPIVGPSDPTPRTVAVEYDVTSFGTDVTNWEVASAGGG